MRTIVTDLLHLNSNELPSQIKRLYKQVVSEQKKKPKKSRTARLFAAGRTKIAKKVVEEAAEVSLDYMSNDRKGVISETADLMYNTMVLLADMDIDPKEVWFEMDRRRHVYGIAGKLPKRLRS
jgi:phosphoribosyl-ATP pyrophosphohydrolase